VGKGKIAYLNRSHPAGAKPAYGSAWRFPNGFLLPGKERFELAILLNNFLASPSFQVWQQGQPLDIQQLLYTENGRPRHSIFYIAHLSENERMFFVTLLFAAVESWMRGQRGTGNLRALLYFDEIMGYLPPIANPPSKTVMLRMLKQARAFGVGCFWQHKIRWMWITKLYPTLEHG